MPSRVATSSCRAGRSNPRRSANGATTWLQTLCGPPAGTELPPQRAPIPFEVFVLDRWTATPAWPVVRSVQSERTVPAAPDRRIRSHADRGSRRRRRRHQHEHADQTAEPAETTRARVLDACGAGTARRHCSPRAVVPVNCRRRPRKPPADQAVRTAIANPGPTVTAPNRSPVCGTNAPQMSSARRRSQSCRSLASRSVSPLMIRREPASASRCIDSTRDRLGLPLAVRHPMRKQRLATRPRQAAIDPAPQVAASAPARSLRPRRRAPATARQ